MPKVSDYELEHFSEEAYTIEKFKKKSKPVKEKKYSDKKDKRADWKKREKFEEAFESSEEF